MVDCSALLSNGSVENILIGAVCPYTNVIGDFFYIFILGAVFYSLLIKNGGAIGVTIIGLLSMALLPYVIPAETIFIAYILIIVAVAGVLYAVTKSRGFG